MNEAWVNARTEYEIVAIGAARSGLRTLETFLVGLPAHFPLPIVVAGHPTEDPDHTLHVHLQAHSALPVSEVEDKDPILPGRVYVAPADYHLLVEKGQFALSTEAPVCGARPSIDVLFESVADAYGPKAIGVVFTGSEEDGVSGLAKLREKGGFALLQNPSTADIAEAIHGTLEPPPAETRERAETAKKALPEADQVLYLSDIAPFLVKLSQPEVR